MLLCIIQDTNSAEDNEPAHDDSYAAELAKLRERSRTRIDTARESEWLHAAWICLVLYISLCV